MSVRPQEEEYCFNGDQLLGPVLIPWYKNHGLNHSQQLLKLFASGGDYSGSSAAAARQRATREERNELKKQAQLNDRLSLLTIDDQKTSPP